MSSESAGLNLLIDFEKISINTQKRIGGQE
jgi:hypothetical protein